MWSTNCVQCDLCPFFFFLQLMSFSFYWDMHSRQVCFCSHVLIRKSKYSLKNNFCAVHFQRYYLLMLLQLTFYTFFSSDFWLFTSCMHLSETCLENMEQYSLWCCMHWCFSCWFLCGFIFMSSVVLLVHRWCQNEAEIVDKKGLTLELWMWY